MERSKRKVIELIFLYFIFSIYSCQKPECFQIIFYVKEFTDNQEFSYQLSLFTNVIKKNDIYKTPGNSSIIVYKSNDYDLQIIDGIMKYKNLYEYEVSCTLNLYKNGDWISSCYIMKKKENLPQIILRINQNNNSEKQILYFITGKYKYITKIFLLENGHLNLTSENVIKY